MHSSIVHYWLLFIYPCHFYLGRNWPSDNYHRSQEIPVWTERTVCSGECLLSILFHLGEKGKSFTFGWVSWLLYLKEVMFQFQYHFFFSLSPQWIERWKGSGAAWVRRIAIHLCVLSGSFHGRVVELSGCDRMFGPRSPRYLLRDLWLKKFPDPCSWWVPSLRIIRNS